MDRIPFTKKSLIDWAGEQAVREADQLVHKGLVLEASYDPPSVTGSILVHNRPMETSFRILPDGNIESGCPCYTNRERGLICSHVIAIALVLIKRATDPLRDAKFREELRRASRLAAIREDEYLKRVPPNTPGATPATVRVRLGERWLDGYRDGAVPVFCEIVARGNAVPLGDASREVPFAFTKEDEALLFVLEDISEGPAHSELRLTRFDLANVIRLHAGRELPCASCDPITVNRTKVNTYLHMDVDRENGELILNAHTELPFLRPGEFPVYVISGNSGWAFGAENLWPLANVLPDAYREIYDTPVIVHRPDVLRFMHQELPAISKFARVESDIAMDLFSVDPALPRFRLLVRGSPASLSAVLYAVYGQIELVAAKPDPKGHFSFPDPADLMRYFVRNDAAERHALSVLAASGFAGQSGDELGSVVGNRQVLNFLGSGLPSLRRAGWDVAVEGRAAPYMDELEFATPVVHVNEAPGQNWFDVAFDFEDMQGVSLSQADIHLALRHGDSFIKKGNRTVLVDADAIGAMQDVFADCISRDSDEPGNFRLASIYAPFVKSSLDALDGVDVEDDPAWRSRAEACNRTSRLEPVHLPDGLSSILRSYQRDGVDWLRFLEMNGFCGLLADEMGLGKTVQTLAWLSLERDDPAFRGKPALIVCPTSIVENWAEEAARFVPALKPMIIAGPERKEKWERVDDADIAIISYALLRRDIDACLQHEFSAMVLDEAQHIKNRSTQNARAAKKVRAGHRVVLTGTPVENSVTDLWSIMDFLMPGYLGSHDHFRQHYERPITQNNSEGNLAQSKLRRKLHPFLLRRLKTEVARDLPPKIERVSMCTLTPDQKLVYKELLATSRRRINGLVSKRGFNKCRMEILATLMRLRQTCCHLGLLHLPDLEPKHPSGKMDLFLELLDEAMDGRHRVLVFSQFVSMLTILRRELETRSVDYCYLDGSTKERMKVVHRFNTCKDIPAFLISLKAGGTGLNLTGADMVIHFDPWWNPAVENQATDRAYRIGQKRTVYSVKLITRGTVEEKVLELQQRKQAVIDATIETDERVMQSLSWEDIRDVLEL